MRDVVHLTRFYAVKNHLFDGIDKHKRDLGLYVASTALALAIGCGDDSARVGRSNPPFPSNEKAITDVVYKWFDSSSKHDWKSMYDVYCSGMKRRNTLEDFRVLAALAMGIGRADRFESIDVSDIEIEGDIASASVSWVKVEMGGDKKNRRDEMYFRRENGKWTFDPNDGSCE